MTDNIVQMFPDLVAAETGYIINGDTIEGIYNENLAAWRQGEEVVVGEKATDGIDNPVRLTQEKMDEFCIMWLAISRPDTLRYQEE